jgi:putative transposase
MARLPRIAVPGIPLHLVQRGNNRQACFGAEEDFAAYAHWLGEYARKCRVAIHAWVFMTNHVHLLLTPQTMDGVSHLMQTLGRHYVRYFNHTYKRTGTLWEGRFKSCVIQAEDYLLLCQRYIELNPVRAGMVMSPDDYPWSSFRANGLGQPAKCWTPHEVYQRLGKTVTERAAAYRELFRGQLDATVLKQIRQASNQGMALGNDRFKQEIERLAGRRVVALKKGPKRKSVDREQAEILL